MRRENRFIFRINIAIYICMYGGALGRLASIRGTGWGSLWKPWKSWELSIWYWSNRKCKSIHEHNKRNNLCVQKCVEERLYVGEVKKKKRGGGRSKGTARPRHHPKRSFPFLAPQYPIMILVLEAVFDISERRKLLGCSGLSPHNYYHVAIYILHICIENYPEMTWNKGTGRCTSSFSNPENMLESPPSL